MGSHSDLKATLVALAVLVLAVTIIVAPVFADFNEGWDTYPAPNTSDTFGPWTFHDVWPGSECSGSSGWNPDNILQYTDAPPYIYSPPGSPPNFLNLEVTGPTCLYSSYGYVSAEMNLSASVVTVTVAIGWYVGTDLTIGSGSSAFASLCNSNPLFDPNTEVTVDDASPLNNYSFTIFGTPGEECTLTLGFHYDPALSDIGQAFGTVVMDNLKVTGANVIMPSANFFMVDCQTRQWFNIAAYPNSSIKVSYPTASAVYYNNVSTPDLIVNTTGASLVTVNVGDRYYDTIIPQNSAYYSNSVYLCDPSTPVYTYTLNVQDLTGYYGPGTQVYVTENVNGTASPADTVLNSGYVDGYNDFQMWQVPGTYTVTLVNGSNVYSSLINLPSTNAATIPIQILKVVYKGTCQQSCTLDYGAWFDTSPSDEVLFSFNDSSSSTTALSGSLQVSNASGVFVLSTFSESGTLGNYQTAIACDTDACNQTIASQGQLSVVLSTEDPYGGISVTIPVSAPGGGLFSFFPDISSDLAGLSYVFPSVNVTYESIVALIVIYLFAGVFGALSAKFGAVLMPIIAGMFIYAGWLPGLGTGFVLLTTTVGVVAFIGYLRQGR